MVSRMHKMHHLMNYLALFNKTGNLDDERFKKY